MNLCIHFPWLAFSALLSQINCAWLSTGRVECNCLFEFHCIMLKEETLFVEVSLWRLTDCPQSERIQRVPEEQRSELGVMWLACSGFEFGSRLETNVVINLATAKPHFCMIISILKPTKCASNLLFWQSNYTLRQRNKVTVKLIVITNTKPCQHHTTEFNVDAFMPRIGAPAKLNQSIQRNSFNLNTS